MIPTGQLLAEIAQSLGYELVGIDLFRTRLSTATKSQLREEVVVLRSKFPSLICRPIAAQFMNDDLIALFEFERALLKPTNATVDKIT